jgi:SpoIIAA-like
VIEILPNLPDGVVGFEAVGKVSSDDYRDVLIPATDAALGKNDKIRLLYVLGERFEGVSAGAAWEDTKLGLEHLRRWELMAVVTDVDWIGHALKAVGWMIPAEVRVFPTSERAAAEAWVSGGGT